MSNKAAQAPQQQENPNTEPTIKIKVNSWGTAPATSLLEQFLTTKNQELDAEDYLELYHVKFYLQDVVTQLIESKSSTPMEQIASYFKSVVNGTAVINRDFRYISKTSRNRLAFCNYVEEVFSSISQTQSLYHLTLFSGTVLTLFPKGMKLDEAIQLVLLLCNDFPKEYITIVYKCIYFKTVKPVVEEEMKDEFKLPTWKYFTCALKSFFFFYEFFLVILDSLFDDEPKKEIESVTLGAKLKSLSRMYTIDAEYSLSVPASEALIGSLQYAATDSSKKLHSFNYYGLLHGFFQLVEVLHGGNAIQACAKEKVSLHPYFANNQEKKLNKFLSGIMQIYDKKKMELQLHQQHQQQLLLLAQQPQQPPVLPNAIEASSTSNQSKKKPQRKVENSDSSEDEDEDSDSSAEDSDSGYET